MTVYQPDSFELAISLIDHRTTIGTETFLLIKKTFFANKFDR